MLKNKKGFSLLEVILVMAMVAISFTAIYGLFAKNMQQDAESRNEVIAASLSQEGIELVRNWRDSQKLNDTGFKIENSSDFEDGDTMVVSTNSDGVVVISADTVAARKIYINANGQYCNDCSGEETIFRRWIEVEDDAIGDNYVWVTSVVKWDSASIAGEREARSKLLLSDWQ